MEDLENIRKLSLSLYSQETWEELIVSMAKVILIQQEQIDKLRDNIHQLMEAANAQSLNEPSSWEDATNGDDWTYKHKP